jgi:aspartate aminotransferase-like enzyme
MRYKRGALQEGFDMDTIDCCIVGVNKKWCLPPLMTQLIVHPETYSLRLFTSTTYVYDLTTYAEYVRSKTTTFLNLALLD